MLEEVHRTFPTLVAANAPVNQSSLALVGYTGFRWATQIDPLWNAYFLGLVLEIADNIEAARVEPERRIVFSYRLDYDSETHRLFRESAWPDFKARSLELADTHEYVLACDISDFYGRVYHHRLENAMNRLGVRNDTPSRIMALLRHFSTTTSYGLPVGGPAARILSELLLNSTDRLLLADRTTFARFADDYHVFVHTQSDAYDALRGLSEHLLRNEGLTLQKSKTRIMSAAEFRSLPMFDDREEGDIAQAPERSFLAISLRFDPYSPTAEDDYEALRAQVRQFDITGMLARELQKSRINVAFARRLVRAIAFLTPAVRDAATLSLMDNLEVLAPILPAVLRTVREVYADLAIETQAEIGGRIRDLIRNGNYLLRIEINLAYALRILALQRSEDNEALLTQLYERPLASFITRDIVLIMARWGAEYWVSDKKTHYAQMHPWVKRAFVVASYVLGEEGGHWRRAIRPSLQPFELLVAEWAEEKVRASRDWAPPI